jgi:hypothetical protein
MLPAIDSAALAAIATPRKKTIVVIKMFLIAFYSTFRTLSSGKG